MSKLNENFLYEQKKTKHKRSGLLRRPYCPYKWANVLICPYFWVAVLICPYFWPNVLIMSLFSGKVRAKLKFACPILFENLFKKTLGDFLFAALTLEILHVEQKKIFQYAFNYHRNVCVTGLINIILDNQFPIKKKVVNLIFSSFKRSKILIKLQCFCVL